MFKKYKEGDILTLGGCQYEVNTSGGSRLYLSANPGDNDFVFTYLGVGKSKYVRDILGYCNDGMFPTCNNIEDLNKVIRKLQEDCLIKEAKERYPEGTKFIPAHTPRLKNGYCISHGEFWVEDSNVLAILKNGTKVKYAADSPSENGNTIINRNVFYEGKWAEIFNDSSIKEPTINTYGLKIGDVLTEEVIREWSSMPNSCNRYDGDWKVRAGLFIGDRKIKAFEVFNGITGFLVSGTDRVHLRAEGFKEFAKGFNNVKQFPNYVRITNNGHVYTNHPSAKEYGCSNYDRGIPPENGWVCKVLNEVLINGVEEGYILEHGGKHYIVCKSGCVSCDDKLDKSKFKAGKYYSFTWIYCNDVNYIVIAKINTVNTDTINVSWRNYTWYADYSSKYSDDDTYNLKDIIDIKELSIEEVQQYLPDEHPDKIPQKKEHEMSTRNYKFNVGDKVRIIKNGYGCSIACLGEVVEILERGIYTGSNGYRTTETIGDSNTKTGTCDYMIGENSFELVDGHPDKIKTPQSEYIVEQWYRLGEWIGKFKKLDGNCFYVFKSGTPFDNYKANGGFLSIDHQGPPVLITDMTEVYKLFPEERPLDSDLGLGRWYERNNFVVYLYARNSVYGFHHGTWFESKGFSEEGLKICHPKKVVDKFSTYIKNKYQIGNIVVDPRDEQVFEIRKLDFDVGMDRITVSTLLGVRKGYGFLFYQGKWAEKVSSIKELNLTTQNNNPTSLFTIEKYYPETDIIMPSYDEVIIKETSLEQESTTELLLKSKNKKQKFVKLTEVKTIKL